MKTWNPDLYTLALNFASKAHKKQTMPGSDLPYLNHIANVAIEVMTAITQSTDINDPDLAVQCALLHDTIEDTEVTYEELKEIFGITVADGVQVLSKNKGLATKAEQMKDSLERIQSQPKEIWMVKMADRISNLQRPPAYWDNDKIKGYCEEALIIYDTLNQGNTIIACRLMTKIEDYKQYFK